MTRAEKARQLFEQGYSCSQAVAVAFCDVTGLDAALAAKMASSFGGGMGRLLEVCGAVSGMFLVLGLAQGYSDADDRAGKTAQYAAVQQLAAAFRQRNGSIICRDLLGLPGAQPPAPEARTAAYYKKRPCADLVYDAAELLEQQLGL